MRSLYQALFGCALLPLATSGAHAADFSFDGYGDARVILPPEQRSWLDGGLGKTRWGGGDKPDWEFAELFGQGRAQITGELSAVVSARIEPHQRTLVDALEAYVKY